MVMNRKPMSQRIVYGPSDDATFKSNSLKTACATCSLHELCITAGIEAKDLIQLDRLVTKRRRVKQGESLFRTGDKFNSLYAVRTGFFKATMVGTEGRSQITGFQIPGELLGLDGVDSGHHSINAVALQDSEVCVLPFPDLERIARQCQPLQHQLHCVMSREIVRGSSVMMLLGRNRSKFRVAAFLLNLSERYSKLGYSPDRLFCV